MCCCIKSRFFRTGTFKRDIRREGERVLRFLKETGKTGIVLAGKPYHIDPEINHNLPRMINSEGFAVLTEDSIAHLAVKPTRKLRVLDQWVYHTRHYDAARVTAVEDCLYMIQLISFGRGLDAISAEQVAELLKPQKSPRLL